eukprot:Tbor_TRINITY_DN2461_c0_g1::TRINITY_DN2461_c0_g1_i1::g.2510::m.2510
MSSGGVKNITANVALLLEKERKANAELTLNAIQLEHTIEAFNKRIVALLNKKNILKSGLIDLREELKKHQMMAELCSLPSELTIYAAAIGVASNCNDVLMMNIKENIDNENMEQGTNHMFAGGCASEETISCKRRGQYNLEFNECIRSQRYIPFPSDLTIPDGGFTREYMEKAYTSAHSCRYNPILTLPACATQNAYCPIVANGTLKRRPVTTDFCVCMVASKVEMGRTVLSKTFFEKGDLLFVDHPFLTVLERPDIILLVEPFDNILTKVLSKKEVFNAQKWDQRLAIAAISYLAEIFDISTDETAAKKANVREKAHFIGCPLEAVDPEQLNSLCEFAKFLHAALPACLQNMVSEDDIAAFFVAFQTNAILHGVNYMTASSDIEEADFASLMVSGEVKRSLFSFLSLVEHSCDPNATVVIRCVTDCDEGGGHLAEVRAIRNIGVGEAISIAYISTLPTTAQRRRTLRMRYFFECMCSRCTEGEDYCRAFLDNDERKITPIGDGTQWKIFENSRNQHISPFIVVRYDSPSILCLLPIEEQFIALTNQAIGGIGLLDEAGESGNWRYVSMCGEVLKKWVESYRNGLARIAPSHCAVVAQALLCSKSLLFAYRKDLSCPLSSLDLDSPKYKEMFSICASVLEILRSYISALVGFCFSIEEDNHLVLWACGTTIEKTEYLTPPTHLRYILSTPPSSSCVFYINNCLIPVLESFGVLIDYLTTSKALLGNICKEGVGRVWYCIQWLLKNISFHQGSEKHLKAQLKASILL